MNIFIACVVGGLLIDCYLLILIVCDWAIHALHNSRIPR